MPNFLSFDIGTKNIGHCYLSSSGANFSILDWSVESCVDDSLNVNKTPIWELAPLFYKWCKTQAAERWLFKDSTPLVIDRIFIENQPMGGRGAARNLKTKILSHILQTMFLDMRPDVPVDFINPSLKLKDMPKPPEGRTTYRENKKYAIAKTEEIIASVQCQNAEACKVLYNVKKSKKDDLADSFLQGLFAGQMHVRGDIVEKEKPEAKKSGKRKREDPDATVKSKAPEKKANPETAKSESSKKTTEDETKKAKPSDKKKPKKKSLIKDEALLIE